MSNLGHPGPRPAWLGPGPSRGPGRRGEASDAAWASPAFPAATRTCFRAPLSAQRVSRGSKGEKIMSAGLPPRSVSSGCSGPNPPPRGRSRPAIDHQGSLPPRPLSRGHHVREWLGVLSIKGTRLGPQVPALLLLSEALCLKLLKLLPGLPNRLIAHQAPLGAAGWAAGSYRAAVPPGNRYGREDRCREMKM